MARNRLQLNFQLNTAAERTEFVNQYLEEIKFVPTEAELETISNYILWGKKENGKNPQQEGTIKLKEWAPDRVESLEGLLDIPGFQETSFKSLREPPAKIPRTVFSRSKALAEAPSYLLPTYERLFRQIDELELTINYYDLFCGKRATPPREALVNKFTAEEQKELNEKALKLSSYKYLKLKHLLVELRTQQYSYYDMYKNTIVLHTGGNFQEENPIYIGTDIQVFPAALYDESYIQKKIFEEDNPYNFTEDELQQVNSILWREKEKLYFDFTNEEHVLELYKLRADLEDTSEKDPYQLNSSAKDLLSTLEYYQKKANLNEILTYILDQKLKKVSNDVIAKYINQTYNKSYNDNYISTLFHQKIITSVAEAARQHRKHLENIFFPENFKKCKDCGRYLLLSTDNFVRQKKSSDGFSPRCKRCEKIKRDSK